MPIRAHRLIGKAPFIERSILYSIPTQSRKCRTVYICNSASTNVLVIGSGGREHALAWKLAQSPECSHCYVAPGNPGTAIEPNTTNVDLNPSNHDDIIKFCNDKDIQFVLVGPEQPLVEGLVDSLDAAGILSFGPTAAAAQLEGSKVFMKNLCRKYNIPTAGYEVFEDPEPAKAFIQSLGAPIVIKASGLAAGKGVIVASSQEEAFKAVDDILIRKTFGSAGSHVVIEEFLVGEEASFFALIDGEKVVPLVGAQDHKAVGEGDVGPNTGGMGSYSPAPVLTKELEEAVMEEIMRPTAAAMVQEGCPFRGVLFAGLMIHNGKAKLLEHNVRFGDPECQSLMVRCKSDLLAALRGMALGEDVRPLEWDSRPSLTVVLASKGYPGSYAKGCIIKGIDAVSGAKVFHAGTALGGDGNVVSAGGRVLGVTALGSDVQEAQKKAYEAVDQIDFPDGFCRRDIGWRAVDRMA